MAAPVDGHSLLPGRFLALVVFIIAQMGDRHEVAAPVDGHSIIVQMGDGAKPLPVDGHSLLPGRSLALVVSLLPNLGTGTKWLLPSMATAYYQGDSSPW